MLLIIMFLFRARLRVPDREAEWEDRQAQREAPGGHSGLFGPFDLHWGLLRKIVYNFDVIWDYTLMTILNILSEKGAL